MSIESVIFGKPELPGEFLRIAVSLIGLAVSSYFDIFNNKTIPDKVLYAFLAAAIALNFIYFNQDILVFGAAVTILMAVWSYTFYRIGYLGAADIFVIVALSLLLPIPPSFLDIPFNIPFVIPVLLFSLVISSLYTTIDFAIKLTTKKTSPNMLYLVFFLPYGVFAYMLINSPLFSPIFLAILTITVLSAIFYGVYRNDILKLQAQKISLSKVAEEDVLAIELMPAESKLYSLKRLINREELGRLKKLKLKEVWVYTKLLPFLPFLFIGFILSIFLGNYLFIG